MYLFIGPDEGFDIERGGLDEDEDGDEDDVDPAEVQRRKERLEREQWLRQQVQNRLPPPPTVPTPG